MRMRPPRRPLGTVVCDGMGKGGGGKAGRGRVVEKKGKDMTAWHGMASGRDGEVDGKGMGEDGWGEVMGKMCANVFTQSSMGESMGVFEHL